MKSAVALVVGGRGERHGGICDGSRGDVRGGNCGEFIVVVMVVVEAMVVM